MHLEMHENLNLYFLYGNRSISVKDAVTRIDISILKKVLDFSIEF